MGKFLTILIVGAAVLAGVGMYYLQVYAYYDEVPARPGEDVLMTSLITGEAEPVLYDNFEAIDSDSSPIRYRGCFTTSMGHPMLSVTYVLAEDAVPLVAPKWFTCFDAEELGAALENGQALAFMGQEHVEYGIDRIVAIHEDGRGFVWHQINRCGEIVFDGNRAPEDCPQPPEGAY